MISILPVAGLPEIGPGDDLAAMIVEAAALESGDVVVVAHKVVSKAEQRVVRLADIEPSERARELAAGERDPRELEVILRETARVVRERAPLVIAETRHGFVCASAGVDHSNASDAGVLVLLPLDPDASARRIRDGIGERTGRTVAVVVSDSFGRPFRHGTTDVAIGVAGLAPLLTCAARPTAAGASCARRRLPSPTSSLRQPTSLARRRGASPSSSFAASPRPAKVPLASS